MASVKRQLGSSGVYMSVEAIVVIGMLLMVHSVHAQVRPLLQGHSHNDYWQKRPLLTALEHGFCSMSADIFLVGEELLVGHSLDELRSHLTLRKLYLDPLKQHVARNGGALYRGHDVTLYILLDVKRWEDRLYPVLERQLEAYRDILTSFEGNQITQGPVTIVLAGNSDWKPVMEDPSRLVALRGNLGIVGKPLFTRSRVPIIVERWQDHFDWDGTRSFSRAEMRQLASIVNRCHEEDRVLGFWGAPDRKEAWQLLSSANVDFVGTDRIEALAGFLRQQEMRKQRTGGKTVDEVNRSHIVQDGPPVAAAPFDEVAAKQHQRAWAKHLGIPVETTNSIGMKLVLIPPGEFAMGYDGPTRSSKA